MKKPPLIMGLDASLTSTGVCHIDGRTSLIRTKLRGPARLVYLRNSIEAQACTADLVVMEGYSFGSKQNGPQLGELGGVVKVALFEMGIPFVIIPPQSLKKIATGIGKGGKFGIMAEAIRRLGYKGKSDDEADAMWLREAGLQFYGFGTVKLPSNHISNLGQFEWPKLKSLTRRHLRG